MSRCHGAASVERAQVTAGRRPVGESDRVPAELASVRRNGACGSGAGASGLILLVGNPNVGKSAIFSSLAGGYAEVSNFPGTTVEVIAGQWGGRPLLDSPGIYGLGDHSEEERIVGRALEMAELVINVVDAAHLDRDLFLTLELTGCGVPMVVALNCADEARRAGVEPDATELERILGVPVVATVGISGEGLPALSEAIERARPGIPVPVGPDDLERRRQADAVYEKVVRQEHRLRPVAEWLARASITLRWGIPMMAVALAGIYLLVGVVVAQHLVGFTEGHLGNRIWEPLVRGWMTGLGLSGPVAEIAVGDFGLLTMTVTYIVFLLTPLVTAFYFALSVLEDSGFLPRIAALVDRGLSSVGLNGRAVIPIILGFGCVTMGTITTRLLATRREKTIATALLNFAIPCSAQLAVIAALLAGLGGRYVFAYAAVMFAMLVILGTVLDRLLPGDSTPLLMELPPMRWPRTRAVLRKTGIKTYWFLKEATPWFAGGALIVALLDVTGGLKLWQTVLRPVVVGWLRLPEDAATAFVMGLVRRDFGAAGLYDMALTPLQALIALVVITLFVPCVASLMVMAKEHGAGTATRIWIGTWIVAFGVGGIMMQLLSWMGMS